MDDWGCVNEEDLFSSTGQMKSLDELVESLISKSETTQEDFNQPRVFSLSKSISPAVEVVAYTHSHPPNGFAPKILKKKTGFAKNVQRPNLKRVTFEVEKFAADECTEASERENARARLAVQLGAQPPKRPYMNYKALKAELTVKKLAVQRKNACTTLLSLKTSGLKKKGTKMKKSRK